MHKLYALLGAALLLGGCGFGMIYDIAPVEVMMEVTDADGRNLFEESQDATAKNWLEGPVTATFEGETYAFPSTVDTRAYAAMMHGLVVRSVRRADGSTVTCLVFGELSGETERCSDLTVTWPNGTTTVITVDNSFHWGITGRPHKKTLFRMNGETVSLPVRIQHTAL